MRGPQLVAMFWTMAEPLENGASLEDVVTRVRTSGDIARWTSLPVYSLLPEEARTLGCTVEPPPPAERQSDLSPLTLCLLSHLAGSLPAHYR